MSPYHFDIADRFPIEMGDTIELDSIDQARKQALRYAGNVLADQLPESWGGSDWVLTVSDAKHLALFTITVSSTDAAAKPRAAMHRAPRHPGPRPLRGR